MKIITNDKSRIETTEEEDIGKCLVGFLRRVSHRAHSTGVAPAAGCTQEQQEAG